MKEMIDITICVCTRKRPEGLKKLLDSFIKMQLPIDTQIKIVVVENDLVNSSESIIKEFSSKSNIRINYFLETKQGIAFARNTSVKGAYGSAFCCFVDDDQVVANDWLVELMRCQKEFNADGVWGINPPIFNAEVPAYISRFHTGSSFNYGDIVTEAYTNCLLLRKEYLDKIEGPFDVRLNFTGGEDCYLTSIISRMGGVIRCNPYAKAFELIPESRTKIKYIIKRTYRTSNTSYFVNSLIENKNPGLSILPKIVKKFCFGLLILFPYLIFGNSNKLIGVEKIADAFGGLSFILGNKNEFYK